MPTKCDCKEKEAKLIQEYESKWPNYCRNCGGYGGFYSQYDPSPAGISLSPGYMEDYDPCSECTEKGICPRCGKKVWDIETESDWVCPECDWSEKEPDGVPEMECPHIFDDYYDDRMYEDYLKAGEEILDDSIFDDYIEEE